MAYIYQGHCSKCEYRTNNLSLDSASVAAYCQVCRDIVVARREWYCDRDPYGCPGCATELSKAVDLACHHCKGGEIEWECVGHANRRSPPPEGRVHFLRLAHDSGRVLAMVHGYQLQLIGATEPGQWTGEGIASGDQIQFVRRIGDSPFRATARLEIHLPEGAPWLAVDLAKLRQGLEVEGKLYSRVYTGWQVGSWHSADSTLARATIRLSPAEMFAMLVSVPPEANCLQAVHDGQAWHSLTEARLAIHYSDTLVHIVNSTTNLRLKDVRCPRRVELWRDEKELARWIQPDMLADLRIDRGASA